MLSAANDRGWQSSPSDPSPAAYYDGGLRGEELKEHTPRYVSMRRPRNNARLANRSDILGEGTRVTARSPREADSSCLDPLDSDGEDAMTDSSSCDGDERHVHGISPARLCRGMDIPSTTNGFAKAAETGVMNRDQRNPLATRRLAPSRRASPRRDVLHHPTSLDRRVNAVVTGTWSRARRRARSTSSTRATWTRAEMRIARGSGLRC